MTALNARPTIAPERYAARLAGAARLTGEQELGALLVGVGADLRYLTGYVATALERLTMLVVPDEGRPTLVVPRLEALPAKASTALAAGLVDLVTWTETMDPIETVGELVGRPGSVAVSDRLWATFVVR